MEETIKLRLPEEDEIIGIVEEKLGGAHFRVYCMDEKTRLCRIPGSKKRSMWIDLNMVVLVKPWVAQPDERGDIILKYNKQQVEELKKRGLLK
ncbi:MAG: translation initiation factor IF-1A [Candidatus Aenigmatarchaeota archaeon]|nr:translation initiation factor eIF-1A [Candidatus Aenigmarchaeota archaeon]RLJ04417.1 MAG: translation initiation factor IF-1A [Candidatus Aenigmarchaeota archaeon]